MSKIPFLDLQERANFFQIFLYFQSGAILLPQGLTS